MSKLANPESYNHFIGDYGLCILWQEVLQYRLKYFIEISVTKYVCNHIAGGNQSHGIMMVCVSNDGTWHHKPLMDEECWRASLHCAGFSHGEMGNHQSAPFCFNWVRWMYPWLIHHENALRDFGCLILPRVEVGGRWQCRHGIDIIVEYAWNEFYTEHLPQVYSRDAKHTYWWHYHFCHICSSTFSFEYRIYVFPTHSISGNFRCLTAVSVASSASASMVCTHQLEVSHEEVWACKTSFSSVWH
jgi:hypothetical protein